MDPTVMTVLLIIGVVFLGLIAASLLFMLCYRFVYLRKKEAAEAILHPEDDTNAAEDDMIKALLTAAIAAYMQDKAGSFRVVSFRKRPEQNRK